MVSMNCPFCSPGPTDIILKNDVGYSRYDKYPVSPGHMLIIPYCHISNLFELPDMEVTILWALVRDCKKYIDQKFHPDGYNVGVNVGQAAGQTVMHVHIHLIPRYEGDVDNPMGGIRGVIPGKQKYE